MTKKSIFVKIIGLQLRNFMADAIHSTGNIGHLDSFFGSAQPEIQLRDRVARVFYSSARFLMKPLWASTDFWLRTVSVCKDSASSTFQKIASVSKSILASCLFLPFAIGGLAFGQVLHFGAYHFGSAPYIHLTGAGERSVPGDTLRVFQQNCCLTAGGFARLFGGLELSDEQRRTRIAEKVEELSPDVICFQEVSDLESALFLYNRLAPQFAEFYLNIGVSPWILKNNSGLFVASKYQIHNPQFQSFADIPGVESMVNKGYFSFSIPGAHLINTHLSPSADDAKPTQAETETRAEEQRRILEAANQFSQDPVLIAADCNTDRVGPFFEGLYMPAAETPEEFRCQTEYLLDRNWRHLKDAKPKGINIDYFLAYHPKRVLHSQQISPTLELDHPSQAISDHPGLLTTVSFAISEY